MSSYNLSSAIEDFRRARQRAIVKAIIARLTGEPIRLLSYEEVRQQLKSQNTSERGLKEIPLDAIVGSVNRYTDFTRDFLPLEAVIPARWARIESATIDPAGLPPIEVYQIGDVYFVKDGNHRVSVARQLGAKFIQAYVTEVQTHVTLTPDIKPEELILKAEYNDFLEHTHLDNIRPDADLTLTVPGQYPILEEHISVHRYYMGLEQKREIPYEEAVAHWYDTVYLPINRMISERGILRDFPGRTDADLYLWIAEHRAALEKELESEVKPEDAARDLADEFSPRPVKVAARLGEKLIGAIIPDSFEAGPPVGRWRLEKMKNPMQDRLFTDILVPHNGQENGWFAADQAIILSMRENSRLHGLHVVPTIKDKNNETARLIQAEFKRRCEAVGVPGSLVIVSGEVTKQICDRARWNDLILLNLMYPPASSPLAALASGFRNMIQRCPKPVLSVPEVVTPLSKALIAYDGSPKALEALYIATYLSGKWGIPLDVVYVAENVGVNPEILTAAQQYLESHDIKATYHTETGSVPEAILKVATEHGCDFILMGGYGRKPVIDVVLGSTVDRVLRESHLPVLFCR